MESPSASYGYARRWLVFAAAGAILAGGSALRFDHISGPYEQPDEPVANYVVSQVLTRPGFDTNWFHTQLGGETGAAQFNFSSYFLTLSAMERLREIAGFCHPNETFEGQTVFFRACSAAFGSLAIALAMLLAFRFGGWGLALCSGLWVAVNPLLVQDSHYARPEAFLTFVTLCLVLTALRPAPVRAWRTLAAGALFGLLVACKVTMCLWFWLPLMASFPSGDPGPPFRWRGRLTGLFLVALGVLAGFAIGAPRAVLDPGGYLAGLRFLKNGYAGTFNFYSHDAGGRVFDYVGRYLGATAGWGVAGLFALGLVIALGRRRWIPLLAVYLPSIAIVAFMGIQRSFFERNLSHAIPLYLVGSALGLKALVEMTPLRAWTRISFIALAAGAALSPAELTGRMVFEGFSGRFEKRRVAQLMVALSGLAAKPLDASHLVRATSDDDPWFQRPRIRGNGPYVVLWQDVNPELTRASLRRLHARFDFEERAIVPCLFDDLPGPNTLRDYLGRTVEVLVFGASDSPPPGRRTGAEAPR